ncbi:MAG: AraC family transcriptional regulator [Oscillospiraceae bacterium]|nr:AraC family transcriptional regulator [Oscillospiraceae bacterium]
MENVRVYEMPPCKMVASQSGMFGDGKLEVFSEWFGSLPITMFPKDYLWYDKDKGGFAWYYMYDESMTVPNDFNIIDFPGGLYLVATDIDGQDNTEAMNAIKNFIKEKGCFEIDKSRKELGNIITSPSAYKVMGYNQMDYYVPVKIK